MRDEKGRWLPGQSANPAGRPKKSLSYYLEQQLKIKGKRAVGKVIVNAVTTGIWQLEDDDYKEVLSYDKWFELVQWLFNRLDGTPAASSSIALEMPQGAMHPAFVEVQPPGGEDDDE